MKTTYFRYLPISSRDRDWGLYVTTAGYVRIPAGEVYPPHGHPAGYAFVWHKGRVLQEFQLHYIARGRGVFETDSFPQRQVDTGSCFLLFPGVWHRYKPDAATGWDEFWAGFSGDCAERLVQAGFFSPRNPLYKTGPEDSLLHQFTELIEVMRAEALGYQQVIASLTTLLLARLHASGRARVADGSHARTVVRQVKRILHGNLDRELDLPGLAEGLQVNYDWLRRVFRHHTGLPLHQYHLQLRISKAMHLLGNSECSIKEVAGQLGYEDQHYFSRVFKKKTGQTPAQWRSLSQGHGRRPAVPS